MKKHYATHVEDTDKLISVAGPILEYETWYEQYKKLMEEQAQRKYGLYTPTSEGGDDFDPSSFDQAWTVTGKTNEDSNRDIIANVTGNGNDLKLTNFGFVEGSGYNQEGEYAGYLITDGVDDLVKSSGTFNLGQDWTLVGEWYFINTGSNDNSGIYKSTEFEIKNYQVNTVIKIKYGQDIVITDQNSVNAVCSDGTIYLKDWTKFIHDRQIGSQSRNTALLIGASGNNYTKIAFKNLALYNKVLSREDCIKAYDYLQTLKAK